MPEYGPWPEYPPGVFQTVVGFVLDRDGLVVFCSTSWLKAAALDHETVDNGRENGVVVETPRGR